MMERDVQFWIGALGLAAHPEGGFYREIHRSAVNMPHAALPAGREGERSLFTSIYYLLGSGDRSCLHRIMSDEIWNFHAGDALRIIIIHPGGELEERLLGGDPSRGQSFQTVVPAGAWFGALTVSGGRYSLVSCIVVPGFDFRDFEMARRAHLLAQYPAHRSAIELLTGDE